MIISDLLQFLKECIFPVFCLECKIEGEWWCESCIRKNTIGVFYCPACHVINLHGKFCFNCQSGHYLNGVAAFLNYREEKIVGQLIKKFKYNFAYDVKRVWKTLADFALINIMEKLQINNNDFVIIPVPLHKSRLKERGFNQSKIIAEIYYKNLKGKYDVALDCDGLVRNKFTQQQAKLNKQERLVNINGAFSWVKNNPPGKVVILVDDVYTSGATMEECAKVLKKAGAQKVFGLVMARD